MRYKIQLQVPLSNKLQNIVEDSTGATWEDSDHKMVLWVDCALVNQSPGTVLTDNKAIAVKCLRKMKTLWPLGTYQMVGFE